MTEKRFTIDLNGFIYDDDEIIEDIMELLNDLNNENEQLKQFREQNIQEYTKLKKTCNVCKKENEQLKQTIEEAYETERTALGKSVLKQLKEQLR